MKNGDKRKRRPLINISKTRLFWGTCRNLTVWEMKCRGFEFLFFFSVSLAFRILSLWRKVMTISMAILSSRWVSSTKQRWLSRWVSATKGNGKGFLIDQAKRGPLSLSVANGKGKGSDPICLCFNLSSMHVLDLSSWIFVNTSLTCLIRYKIDEVKIQTWKNHEKRKAVMEMKKWRYDS